MNKALMIGELGRKTGTKLNTIRFYEEVGLLPKPARTASGRRIYGMADLQRLRFIRHARNLGFGTEMIRSLLDLTSHPDRGCGEARAIALRHLAEVETRIDGLNALKAQLGRLVGGCTGARDVADCAILEALAG